MSTPFFYIAEYNSSDKIIQLDEDTSRHVISVLRMTIGEQILLTDGKGSILTAEIMDDHRKRCSVTIIEEKFKEKEARKITIAISLLKNANRFEWFIEKATEIGISEIIPMICERTEKLKFKTDRFHNILVSAMLQSQQCWLPVLHEPTQFNNLTIKQPACPAGGSDKEQKFIAHCDELKTKNILSTFQPFHSSTILIGPEGDFTQKEINLALNAGFIPVSLGETRLRTETAAVVSATLLKMA